MSSVISIGSLTLDLFFQDESLTLKQGRFFLAVGGKYVVEKFVEGVGGGGGNVAVGLSRAGHKTFVWGQLGSGGVSKLIREKLEKEHVDCTLLEGHEQFTNISSILLSPKGERTIINHRSHEVVLSLNEERTAAITKADLIYLGNMPELSLDFRTQILETAKKGKAKTALNLGVKDCRRGKTELEPLLERSDYIIINRHELADMLGTPANELLLKEVNYIKELPVQDDCTLVITDGEFGSYAYSDGEILYQPIVPVDKVVDTTGAGDSFTSAFLAGTLYGKTVQESLNAGAKNSASIITRVNAQDGLLTKSELFSD